MSDLNVIKFELNGPTDTGLAELEKIDSSGLTEGGPVNRGHNYFTDDTKTVNAGVWDCTPMTTKLAPIRLELRRMKNTGISSGRHFHE